MKKLYTLFAAATLMTASISAQDIYIIGDNVDGQSWALGTNQMTSNGDGTYTWSGTVLGNGFKFNDGTWSNDSFNFGGSDKLKLGVPYTVEAGGSSANIQFDGLKEVDNPKVVFDLNKLTVTVTGDGVENGPVPEVVDLYVIGNNVDGQNWALGTNKMTYDSATGNYTWTGNLLGEGFKINDGSWSNGDYNIGSTSKTTDLLTIGTPFKYTASSNSQDIFFDGVSEVANPVVIVNLKEGTILVTDVAGVHNIEADLDNVETIYNLQGVRINRANMTPGIYVINGKKVAIK